MTEPLIRGGGDGLAVFQSRCKKRRERETAAAILDEQERPSRTAPGSFRPFQSKNFKFQTYNCITLCAFQRSDHRLEYPIYSCTLMYSNTPNCRKRENIMEILRTARGLNSSITLMLFHLAPNHNPIWIFESWSPCSAIWTCRQLIHQHFFSCHAEWTR